MSCKPVCKLCDRLVISRAVTFTGGNLVINLPAGNYRNGCKYCIVVAQAIPLATTINAPVVVTIGTGAQQYPLTNRCCAQLTVCAIRTRTRYATVVSTSGTGARLSCWAMRVRALPIIWPASTGRRPPRPLSPRPERRHQHGKTA